MPKLVYTALYSKVLQVGKIVQEGFGCIERANSLQLEDDGVIVDLRSNWAVARNYEEMLEIYTNHFPETPFEVLKQTAQAGFQYFRMAESIDKGVIMLTKIAK